jgi:four helix bundle protein
MEGNFRFENLQVWKDSIVQTKELSFLVRKANEKNNFAFASQFSRALISISNNIAEGSGSVSDKEFARFLNMAHRSLFFVLGSAQKETGHQR